MSTHVDARLGFGGCGTPFRARPLRGAGRLCALPARVSENRPASSCVTAASPEGSSCRSSGPPCAGAALLLSAQPPGESARQADVGGGLVEGALVDHRHLDADRDALLVAEEEPAAPNGPPFRPR